VFFPTVQAKTSLTGFPNQSDRFSPVGCRDESEKASVVLWLFLVKGGEVFGAGFLSEGFLGNFWTNRPDQFAKPV
jgi:hypothetical protein